MVIIAPVAATTAGALVIVDGTGTSDPEGDALTFSWNFGDGVRASGSTAAHVYGSAGTFTITLTVRDATGAQASATTTVTVAAGPAPGSAVPVAVKVKDITGALQAGATVSLVGGAASAMTNASGIATLQVPRGVAQTLRTVKAGFASKVSVVTLTPTQTAGHLDVVLRARLPSTTINATTGGIVMGFNGAVLDLPAGAVVDANGVAVTGSIDVALTPVDGVRNADAFPGAFLGISASGTRGPIASYGTTEFSLTRNGAPLNLAPGRTATIELPMDVDRQLNNAAITVGTGVLVWSLDETTGLWVHEGVGTVVASTSATGLSLRATVGHFSWWNADTFYLTRANPQPQCCIDADADGLCDANGNPEYCWLRGTTNCPNGPACPAVPALPTTTAETFIPGTGGVTLPVPANVPVFLIADAPNGTHHGVLQYTGLPNANDVPVILMTPTGIDGGAVDITLPSVQTGTLTTPADQHVYRFVGQANDFLAVRAFRANGLPLEGTVRVDGPNGYTHDQVAFGYGGTVGRGGTINMRLPFSGQWLVSVKGTAGLPNAYSLSLSTTPAGVFITSTSPAYRAVDVPLDAGVWAQFSGSLAGTPAASNTSGLFIGGVTEVGQTVSLSSQQLVINRPAPLFADTNYSLVVLGSQLSTGFIVGTGVDGGQADWAGRVTIPFRTVRVPGEPSVVDRDVSLRRAAAMFDDGRRLFAWGDTELKVASYTPDAGWTAPQVLRGGDNWIPCLATSGSRALLASAQLGAVSTSWWNVSRFSPVTSLGAGVPSAVVGCALSSTQGLVAYQSNGFPLTTQTWLVASSADGGWQAPLLAMSDGGTMQGKIPAAMNAAGAGLVAWARLGANGRTLDTARLTASGWVVEPETVLVTNQPQSLGVGVDDVGTMVVTWFDAVALVYRAIVRIGGGAWSAPTTVFAADSAPIACTNSDVQVVPTTGGGFTIFACVGTPAGVQVLSRSWSGGMWGTTDVVATVAGAGPLLVKADHAGFAWLPSDTAGRVLRANGTWGPLFTQTGPGPNGTLPVVSPGGKTGFVYDVDSHEAFLEGP